MLVLRRSFWKVIVASIPCKARATCFVCLAVHSVTCFFLDCLPDPVAALEAVHSSLAPGGLWVCAGPLAYHHWPQLSPTLQHWRTLAREVGLQPLGAPELVPAPYVRPPHSLRHDADWTAAMWVCRRE